MCMVNMPFRCILLLLRLLFFDIAYPSLITHATMHSTYLPTAACDHRTYSRFGLHKSEADKGRR